MEQPSIGGSPRRPRTALAILLAGLLLPAGLTAASLDPEYLAAGPGCAPDGAALTLRPAPVRNDRPARAAPRHHAAPAPQAEEPPATLRHAFYACTAAPRLAVPVGAGWLAVGPLRKG